MFQLQELITQLPLDSLFKLIKLHIINIAQFLRKKKWKLRILSNIYI